MRLRLPIATILTLLCMTAVAVAAPASPQQAGGGSTGTQNTTGSPSSSLAAEPTPSASEVSRYVIGGGPAETAVWPFLAAVSNPVGLCSGELIAAQWVLTARHCVQSDAGVVYPPGLMEVRLGNGALFGRGWETARRVVPYPDYNPSTSIGDLALIELPTPTTRETVDLALSNPNPTQNAAVWIAGWGLTSNNGPIPDDAQQAQTVLWNQAYCNKVEPEGIYSDSTELCAGGPGELGGQYPSVCNGDSGGPLVAAGAGAPWTDELFGITDYGSSLECDSSPNVFQDIPAHSKWIIKTTGLAPVEVLATHETHATHTSATVTVRLRPSEDHTTAELVNASGTVVSAKRVQAWRTEPFALTVSGLSAGVRYPGYRVITKNAYGSTGGTHVALSTLAIPCRVAPHGACRGHNIRGRNLTGRNLTGIDLQGANATSTQFARANLSGANLAGADLTRANLAGANLTGANLGGANLTDANLTGATLPRANLRDAHLRGARLERGNLNDASSGLVTGVPASLPTHWSLIDGYLIGPGASLPRAKLGGAHLPSADLSGSDLAGADLRGADLSNANLSNAALTSADLASADLTDANLASANLTGATLSLATLTGVIWSNTTCPDGTTSATNGTTPPSCVGH